ncbi:glycosyltransferase family 1 protein [Synechococcus sp. CS-1328]|uniref:glycosyltransferase family 4 protein n=1 Tax=Synechococcus sp. CS-1328 TaxID=2847976 RepID=UPI00223AEC8E|nr:glycosyltransferase family 1 protein [Synechococcus sp. CS-1328]MCT0224972.1 glycosyltransferase family 4 protein [Synechococcus sp. CS-1328]
MAPLNIAFDVSQTGRRKAGCGFYAAALIDGLLASGAAHHFTLLTSFGDFFHDPTQAAAFPHRRQGVAYGPRLLRRSDAEAFWRDQQRVNERLGGFDLVHANNFWCPPWRLPCRLIYTLYDMSFAEHPEWTTEKNRLGCFQGVLQASLHADWLVAISHASKRAFLRHYPHVVPERVRVIHPASRFDQPGFDVQPAQPRGELFRSGQPFLLSTGTIEPRKNQRFLLEVYNRFRERGGAAIPLVLAGGKGWLMEGFEKDLAASPWAADIHLLGYVRDRELVWLYRHCLVNLYPSHYEGFGLPVLEGMGQGAPVISSNSTSLPEIVADAGLLLAPDDRDGWVEAIESLVAEPRRREALAVAARQRAAGFSWEESTGQLLDLYAEAGSLERRHRLVSVH